MTITSTTRAVTYVGDDVNTTFSFSFKVLEASHLLVQVLDTNTGITSDISSSNYSVTGIGDENGGEVTYPLSGNPLTPTDKITISRVVPPTQGLSITNQGGFFPNLVEEQFDLIVMMAQQYNEELARALKLNITSSLSGLEVPEPVASTVLQWNANADGLENGPTSTEISAAEGYANDAKTSETNAAASATAAATSETNAAASFDSFDDRYLGAKSSDPSTDNDGNALIEGALYWNTTSKVMRVYDGAAWGPFGTAEPSDGDKGDITVSSNGTVWDINSGAVTDAMLANDKVNVAGDTMTGNLTISKADAAVDLLDGGNTTRLLYSDTSSLTAIRTPDVSGKRRFRFEAGGGQNIDNLWVRKGAANHEIYSRFDIATQAEAEAGTDDDQVMTPLKVSQAIDALASGGPTQVRKTVTETITESTVLQNDDELLYALAANEIVRFSALLRINSSSTPDIKFGFTVPTGATLSWMMTTPEATDEVATSGGSATMQTSGNDQIVVLEGTVVNGGTSGNLQLQWAQNTSSVGSTSVLINSILTVWTI